MRKAGIAVKKVIGLTERRESGLPYRIIEPAGKRKKGHTR